MFQGRNVFYLFNEFLNPRYKGFPKTEFPATDEKFITATEKYGRAKKGLPIKCEMSSLVGLAIKI